MRNALLFNNIGLFSHNLKIIYPYLGIRSKSLNKIKPKLTQMHNSFYFALPTKIYANLIFIAFSHKNIFIYNVHFVLCPIHGTK